MAWAEWCAACGTFEGRHRRAVVKALVVPVSFQGGADRAGPLLGLRESGAEWVGDCPACEASEALAVRPSSDGDTARVLCVCRGACVDAAALRAALSDVLGPGSCAVTPRSTRTDPDLLTYGGALSRKRR